MRRNMRHRLVLIAALACWSSSAIAQKAQDNRSEFVEFDGNRLYCAYEGQVPGTTFREYIPQNEDLKTWSKMARIDHYLNIDDPKVLAATLAQLTKDRNPKAPLEVRYNKEKQVATVDFIIWPPDYSYVEYNVFRIEKEGKNGLVSYCYAVREYDDPAGYVSKFRTIRKRLVSAMNDEGMRIHRHSSPPKRTRQ